MLELQRINPPKRLNYIRMQRQNSHYIHSHSEQLTLLNRLAKIQPTIDMPLPSERTSHKNKQQTAYSTFNVCRSKNVFAFTRKPSKRKEGFAINPLFDRRLWNTHDKIGTEVEMFLPNSPRKKYRILPQASYSSRKSNH